MRGENSFSCIPKVISRDLEWVISAMRSINFNRSYTPSGGEKNRDNQVEGELLSAFDENHPDHRNRVPNNSVLRRARCNEEPNSLFKGDPIKFESKLLLYASDYANPSCTCCGLDLMATTPGLRIERIRPGFRQADLLVGDVITRIGRVCLSGMSEDEQRGNFGETVCNGINISITRYSNYIPLAKWERRLLLSVILHATGNTISM